MQPTFTQERVELLDILRGVAIFGMFTVNMTADIWWSDSFTQTTLSTPDDFVLVFVDLFTNGKFITIFSFLFGIGFYVQSERVLQRAGRVSAFWARRLAGLLLIGLIAEACTLPAWILIDYSLFGLGLLLFYRLPPRWIMVAAISTFVVAKFRWAIFPLLFHTTETATQVAPTVLDAIHESDEGVFAFGSFVEIGSMNLVHVWEELTRWQYYLGDLDLLGLMLIGLWVGRIGAVWNRETQVAVASKSLPWLLGIGFIGCVGWIVMKKLGVGEESPQYLQSLMGFLAWPLGMPVLGLGYAAGVALLVDRPGWKGILERFAPMGRMALSNYLFTGLVMAVLSFQWGFGLYGKIYPAKGLVIVLAALPLQLLLSRWWLARFAYGPIEWAWRAWTYGQLPRLRLANTPGMDTI